MEQEGCLSAAQFTPLCFLLVQLNNIVSSAKFGDLIEFSYPVGYSHWAVYDEDGHVMHFAVAGMKHARTRTHTHNMKLI